MRTNKIGNRTRATLVGGERSHHCAIPAPRWGGERSDFIDAATCNISRRVEVSRLKRQPAFLAFKTRKLVRSLWPEGAVINLKNDPARGIGAVLSSPYGRSFTSMGLESNVLTVLSAS